MVFVSSCSNDADPNPRRLIKSIAAQTFDYDNNSNLVEIRHQNNIISKYTYDAQNRLETAINYNYNGQIEDSIVHRYSGNSLTTSEYYQYFLFLVPRKTVFSNYALINDLLVERNDSIILYQESGQDSIISRTVTFTYDSEILKGKKEIYSNNTVIEFTFQYDTNINPFANIFGNSYLFHSPQLIEAEFANDQSVWPPLFQSINNLTEVSYTRDKGCYYGNPSGGRLRISFEYDEEHYPKQLTRGLFDTCLGVGPDVLTFLIEYY